MEKIDTGTDQLLVEKEDGVATITLNRPQARNCLLYTSDAADE